MLGRGPRLIRQRYRNWDWVAAFWAKVDKSGECWIWTGAKNPKGYGQAWAWPLQKMWGAHRVSYALEIGPIPKGLLVRHKCDVRLCVRPSHLLVGTQLENMADAVERNRVARGERQAHSLLTEKEVVEIRAKYVPQKYTQQKLADEYGVARVTISDITRGATW